MIFMWMNHLANWFPLFSFEIKVSLMKNVFFSCAKMKMVVYYCLRCQDLYEVFIVLKQNDYIDCYF